MALCKGTGVGKLIRVSPTLIPVSVSWPIVGACDCRLTGEHQLGEVLLHVGGGSIEVLCELGGGGGRGGEAEAVGALEAGGGGTEGRLRRAQLRVPQHNMQS